MDMRGGKRWLMQGVVSIDKWPQNWGNAVEREEGGGRVVGCFMAP